MKRTCGIPEGEDGERPVGLMGGGVGHRLAPEIVEEELPYRPRPLHVRVPEHGAEVIVNVLSRQTVNVNGQGRHHQQEVQLSLSWCT